MRYTTLRLAVAPPIAWLTLNRSQDSNCVNLDMALELGQVVGVLQGEEEVRALVVTGAGEVFSAGREPFPVPGGEQRGQERVQQRRAASALAEIEMPVVAAINGDALDHGLELALACDLRVAARGARLGITDLSRGVLPWDGGSQRLPRLVGRARALEMLLTSRLLSAEEAKGAGLVNAVVEAGELEATTRSLALQMAEGAPIASRYLKEAVCKGLDMTLEQGLSLEADLSILLHATADRAEGIRSFLERRDPRFSGR